MLLRWWKQRGALDLVGLDIGSHSIKALQINSSEEKRVIEKLGSVSLPPNAVVKGEIKDKDAVCSNLETLFKQSQIKSKYIALAIPNSTAIIKNITIDSRLSASEIESRAWIEANHYFPDLVGNIYLDFVVTPSQDPAQLDLALVACRKDQIKVYLETLEACGLIPKVIDINSYALERALGILRESYTDLNTIGLLNLDSNLSTTIIMENNQLIYAHDHSYDGQRLLTQTQEYINSLGNERTVSLSDAAYVETLKSILSAHLRYTMHIFYSSRHNITLQKMFLSGDCAAGIPYLAEFIQQEIGVETMLANSFEKMEIGRDVNQDTLKKMAPSLMLSCGLALSVNKVTEV